MRLQFLSLTSPCFDMWIVPNILFMHWIVQIEMNSDYGAFQSFPVLLPCDPAVWDFNTRSPVSKYSSSVIFFNLFNFITSSDSFNIFSELISWSSQPIIQFKYKRCVFREYNNIKTTPYQSYHNDPALFSAEPFSPRTVLSNLKQTRLPKYEQPFRSFALSLWKCIVSIEVLLSLLHAEIWKLGPLKFFSILPFTSHLVVVTSSIADSAETEARMHSPNIFETPKKNDMRNLKHKQPVSILQFLASCRSFVSKNDFKYDRDPL